MIKLSLARCKAEEAIGAPAPPKRFSRSAFEPGGATDVTGARVVFVVLRIGYRVSRTVNNKYALHTLILIYNQFVHLWSLDYRFDAQVTGLTII